MKTEQLLELESLFLALSDMTRLRLLDLMSGGPVSVGYLTDRLGESQPKISRHLAYMRNAGLVSASRDGKRIYYSVSSQQSGAAAEVLECLVSSLSGSGRGPDIAAVHTSSGFESNGRSSDELPVYLL